jgi:stage V sporulation protein B
LLALLATSKYIAAAYPMSILAYGVGFLTIFYVMSFVLNGAGKTKIPMWISIFGVILNTVLNYFLIKKYALAGSAVATTITSFIVMVMILFYLQRDFGRLMSLKSLLKISLAGIMTYLASRFFSNGAIVFLLWSTILFAFYLLLLYVMGEITRSDLAYLQKIIAKKNPAEVEAELSGNEPSA